MYHTALKTRGLQRASFPQYLPYNRKYKGHQTPNLNDSHLVLDLSLPNLLMPGVKSKMKK